MDSKKLGKRRSSPSAEPLRDTNIQFGTDGVRGRAHDELTVGFVDRLARAVASVVGSSFEDRGRVIIGSDTRESSPVFVASIASAFASAGVDVIDLGVVPTPMVSFECARRDAMGAMVSASHNPWYDNGIKLFGRGGLKLSHAVEMAIEAELVSSERSRQEVSESRSSSRTVVAQAAAEYGRYLVEQLDGRRLDGMKVVLDTANGSAYDIAPAVLGDLGAEVIPIAAAPNGRNINDGCGAIFPGHVLAHVVKHGADLGVALDGDGDRLIAVTGAGEIVSGDQVVAICAIDLRQRGRLVDDTVVASVIANSGLKLAMGAADITVIETAVGDRHVLEALDAGGYSLGGEPSGHVIFRDVAASSDGLLTAIVLLDIVCRSGRTLAELAAEAMTPLPQVVLNVPAAVCRSLVAEQISDEIAAVERKLGETGRVLVRASGTEPLIRILVEASTEGEAQRAAEQLASVIRDRLA